MDSSSGVSHYRNEESADDGAVTGSYEVEYPGCVIRKVDYTADINKGFHVLSINRRSCESGEIIREDLPVEHWDKRIFGYKVLPKSDTQRNPNQKVHRLVTTTSSASLFEEQVTPNPFGDHVSMLSRRTPTINYLGDGESISTKKVSLKEYER